MHVQKLNIKYIGLWLLVGILFESKSYSGARFQELLKPLDLENIYGNNSKLISRKNLYQAVLGRNLTLKQARTDLDIARIQYEFTNIRLLTPQPVLRSSYTQTRTVSSGTSYSRAYSLGVGVTGSTDFGLSYDLGLPTLTQTKSYIDSLGNLTSESNTAAISALVTFSLLKGSVFFQQGTGRRVSELTFDSSNIALKATLLTTLTQAESSYYDVLLKAIRCKVQERTLEASQALLQDVKEMLRVGESDSLSVLKVELQVSQTEVDLLSSQAELNSAVEVLRDQLSFDFKSQDSILPDPKELYKEVVIPKVSLEQAIQKAKTHRPDYLLAIKNLERVRIENDVAFSQTLPSLNLKLGYGYSATSDGWNRALGELAKLGPAGTSIGLEFSYLLFNDTEVNNYRVSRLNLLKTETSVALLNNQIRKELASLLINIDIAQKRMKNTVFSRELAEKKLAAEFKKFRSGESNIRNVVDFQAEVSTNRIAEITSRVDLQKNWTNLRAALGEFPEGVQVQ